MPWGTQGRSCHLSELCHHWAFKLLYLKYLNSGYGQTHLKVPRLSIHHERCAGEIEKVLQVLHLLWLVGVNSTLPPLTLHSGGKMLPSLQLLNFLPKYSWGRSRVSIQGIAILLPHPCICLNNSQDLCSLYLMIPLSCLWSPASWKFLIGLLLLASISPHVYRRV